MSKLKNTIYIVSGKESRGVVLWTRLNYEFQVAENGNEKTQIHFTANVRLLSQDDFAFSGIWHTDNPKELVGEISFHAERIGNDVMRGLEEAKKESVKDVAA